MTVQHTVDLDMILLSVLPCSDLPFVVQVALAPVAFLAGAEFVYGIHSTVSSQLLFQLFYWASRAFLDDT